MWTIWVKCASEHRMLRVAEHILYETRVKVLWLAGWLDRSQNVYRHIYRKNYPRETYFLRSHIVIHMYYALNSSLYTIYWTLLRTLRLHMYEYKYIAGIVMIKHCCGDTRASDFYEKGHFYFYIYCIRVEWKWDCENCAMAPKGKK